MVRLGGWFSPDHPIPASPLFLTLMCLSVLYVPNGYTCLNLSYKQVWHCLRVFKAISKSRRNVSKVLEFGSHGYKIARPPRPFLRDALKEKYRRVSEGLESM